MFVDAGRFHRIRCTFHLIGIEWGDIANASMLTSAKYWSMYVILN